MNTCVKIDSKCDYDSSTTEKFKNVQKAVFSLSFLGLTPNSISPDLQAFMYKTYCLSTFTYALETTTLKKSTIDYLNVCQNNTIRQIIGLKKYCHISKILKCLKLFNMEQLYVFSKICFLNSIKYNSIRSDILTILMNEKDDLNRNSTSFKKDFKLLEMKFNNNIVNIFINSIYYKKTLKNEIETNNCGICASIITCFTNFKIKFYRDFLHQLTRVEFYE